MEVSEAADDPITLVSNWIPKGTICPNTSSLVVASSKGKTPLGCCEFPPTLLTEVGGALCASVLLHGAHSFLLAQAHL